MNNYKVLYLTEDVDNQAILKILTLNNTLDLESSELRYYKKLAEWALKQRTKIKNINLDNIELSDRSLVGKGISARTNSLLSTLNELNSKLAGKFDANNETSKKVQQLTVDILAGLSKIKNPIQTEEQEPEKQELDEPGTTGQESEGQALYAGMDWTAEKARRLQNANGKATSKILDKFYNDYYKIEYAGLKSPEENDTSGVVNKLKSLDKILIQEFNKLGYNPIVNPLAQFLKNLIKYRPDIFEKLNTNNYGAIHNSFIDKYITGNMLGHYDTYKDTTILYCSDLYNYKGLDIVKYLLLQSQALNAAEDNNRYSEDKDLIAKMFIKQNIPDDSDYLTKIEYLFGQNPDNTITTVISPSDKNNAKLKSEPEISEIYRHLFNSAPKKQVNIEAIIDQAKTKAVIFDMIRHLLDQDDFERTYKDLSKDMETWLKNKQYKRNDDKIKVCKELLSGYLIKDVRVMQKIVTSLKALQDKSEKAGTNI